MQERTSVRPPRGRPRSFDEEAAVERAMNAFWSRGYHGTALPDLLRATKLSRGSLYAAFGGKRALFLRALDRYMAERQARMNVELDPRGAPIAGLRAWLAGNAERASGADGRRGCLVVATAMELAAHDAQIQRRIGGYFKTMEAKLADALSRAQAAGELADGVDPATAARLLVSVAAGQRVIGKTVPDRATMQAPVDALFDQFTK